MQIQNNHWNGDELPGSDSDKNPNSLCWLYCTILYCTVLYYTILYYTWGWDADASRSYQVFSATCVGQKSSQLLSLSLEPSWGAHLHAHLHSAPQVPLSAFHHTMGPFFPLQSKDHKISINNYNNNNSDLRRLKSYSQLVSFLDSFNISHKNPVISTCLFWLGIYLFLWWFSKEEPSAKGLRLHFHF